MRLTSPARWRPPPAGMVKVNCDAALFEQQHATGVGWVMRDSSGKFLATAGCLWHTLYDPLVAEAMSIREALSWIKDRRLSNVQVETECLIAAQAISATLQQSSSFGLIVDDCLSLLSSLYNVSIKHVKRSANCVAHSLARATNSQSGPLL